MNLAINVKLYPADPCGKASCPIFPKFVLYNTVHFTDLFPYVCDICLHVIYMDNAFIVSYNIIYYKKSENGYGHFLFLQNLLARDQFLDDVPTSDV